MNIHGTIATTLSKCTARTFKEGQWSRFEKVNPDEFTTYGVPYDYKSIMHYRKGEFALRGKIAIETLDPRYQDVIGNQNDASLSDYIKICKMYQCRKCLGQNSSGSGGGEVEQPEPTVAPVIIIVMLYYLRKYQAIPVFALSEACLKVEIVLHVPMHVVRQRHEDVNTYRHQHIKTYNRSFEKGE
ncbi:hypothetical protein RB195_004672 [Necator americanus]